MVVPLLAMAVDCMASKCYTFILFLMLLVCIFLYYWIYYCMYVCTYNSINCGGVLCMYICIYTSMFTMYSVVLLSVTIYETVTNT